MANTTITPDMQEQIQATISLANTDFVEQGRNSLYSPLQARLERLVETCIAYATHPLEQKNRQLEAERIKYSDLYVDEEAKTRRLESDLEVAEERIQELEKAWNYERGTTASMQGEG